MNIIIIHEVGYLSKPVYEYQDFAERLVYLGHTVTVIDFDEGASGPLRSQIISKTGLAEVRLISLPNLGIPILGVLYARYQFGVELKRLLSSQKVDAVFLYSVFVNGVSAVKICNQLGIRVVYRVLDAYHQLRKSAWQSWLLKQGESYIYRQANLLAVTNQKMNDYVHQIAGSACVPTVVLDHGVDTHHFQLNHVDLALANALKISTDDFVAVFLGTTYAFSQLDALISRIPKICDQIPNFKLLIIGAGELDQNIRDQITLLNLSDKVVCCGMIDYTKLPQYLSLATIAILPFQINNITKDIVPIKILQYLSSGLPVVSTPLPDVMNHFPNKVSGVMYSNSDSLADFIDAMQATIKEGHLQELANLAREYVSTHYSMDVATDHLQNILTSTQAAH
jgi:glycosyltransferase involved in cell wall biosynthesis